jgi:uroporphyrin-III C-methyltransferase/precorrin-2 dehydrogenase/sirohydrochlorin ferrochelatase
VAQSVTFVSGHVLDDDSLDWRSLARAHQTVVFYMGVGHLPQIIERLRESGAAAQLPAAVVEKATLPDQRTLRGTLATISGIAQAADVAPPALFIVGDVTALGGADAFVGTELEALA